MRIFVHSISSLSENTISILRKLTRNGGKGNDFSLMRLRLNSEEKKEADKVFILKDKSEIIGWSYLSVYKKHTSISVYVKPRERRKGLGSKLIERTIKYVRKNLPSHNMYVYPHDKGTEKFFSQFTKNLHLVQK